jgi:hypothetical protein
MKPYSLLGPRAQKRTSKSRLSSYDNLILLCGRCHSLIDKNTADYPVSVLRQFKVQHERWVAESLNANAAHVGPTATFYRTLLGQIDGELKLNEWLSLIDHLWNDQLPTTILDRGGRVAHLSAATLWPGTRPKLGKTIKAALAAWIEYCRHFESFCEPSRGGEFAVREHAYQGASGYVQWQFDVKADKWSAKNKRLLVEYVGSLNRMVKVVRGELDPVYRQDRGYFTIPGVLSPDGETFVLVPGRGRRRRSRARPMATVSGNRRARPRDT